MRVANKSFSIVFVPMSDPWYSKRGVMPTRTSDQRVLVFDHLIPQCSMFSGLKKGSQFSVPLNRHGFHDVDVAGRMSLFPCTWGSLASGLVGTYEQCSDGST